VKSVTDSDKLQIGHNAQGKTIVTVNPTEIIKMSDPIALDWNPQQQD
jgi:hypothetical protein